MDEELLKQLNDLAGSGDQEAAFALQRAQAAKLRNEALTSQGRASPMGAALSSAGRAFNAYAARQQDEAAQAGAAGLQAKKAGLVRSLQARQPKTPEEYRALSMALAGAGANPLAAMGKQYEDAAVAGEKEAMQHQKLVNLLTTTGMKLDAARAIADQTYNRPTYTNTPGDMGHSGVITRPDPSQPGGLNLTPVGTPKPQSEHGGNGRDIVILTGEGGLQYRYNKVTKEMEAVTAPPGAPGAGPPGAAPKPFIKGAPQDVQKLSEDLAFVSKMPEDLALLEKYRGKDAPGMGPLAGRLPDWATSSEGNEARQAAMRLVNALVYMSSGKQINEAEMRRILVSRGIGPEASQSAFDAGIVTLKRDIAQATRNFVNGRGKGVVDLARQRGVLSGLEPFLGASPGNGAAPAGETGPHGKVVRTGTKGSKRVVQYEDGFVEEK